MTKQITGLTNTATAADLVAADVVAIEKADGSVTYQSTVDVLAQILGKALNGATALTGAGSATGDKFGIWDADAAVWKSITRAELIVALSAAGATSLLGLNISQTVSGAKYFTGGIGLASEVTFDITGSATLSTSQNDYALASRALQTINCTSAFDFTGFAAVAAKQIWLVNNGSDTFTIKHQSTGSAEANRVICANSADIAVAPGSIVFVWYDDGATRYRASLLGTSAAIKTASYSGNQTLKSYTSPPSARSLTWSIA